MKNTSVRLSIPCTTNRQRPVQGATLPPLVVYFNGVDFWLADGFHRYHSYRAAGVAEVAAEVRTGSPRRCTTLGRSAPTPLTSCAASTKHAQGFTSAVAKVPGAPCSATPAEIVWIR
jgi:hypothetical protein